MYSLAHSRAVVSLTVRRQLCIYGVYQGMYVFVKRAKEIKRETGGNDKRGKKVTKSHTPVMTRFDSAPTWVISDNFDTALPCLVNSINHARRSGSLKLKSKVRQGNMAGSRSVYLIPRELAWSYHAARLSTDHQVSML